jgi:hypothetical protein
MPSDQSYARQTAQRAIQRLRADLTRASIDGMAFDGWSAMHSALDEITSALAIIVESPRHSSLEAQSSVELDDDVRPPDGN